MPRFAPTQQREIKMTPTPLQKAQEWQKQLDKAVAAIVYEDATALFRQPQSLENMKSFCTVQRLPQLSVPVPLKAATG